MRTETKKIYMYRQTSGVMCGHIVFSTYSGLDDGSGEYMLLSSAEVDFRIALSAEEELQAQVDGLKKDIQTVRATAQAKVTDLEARIQSLLSITHQPEEA